MAPCLKKRIRKSRINLPGFLVPLLFLSLLALGLPLQAGEKISPAITRIIEDPLYASAHWGLLAADLRTGEAVCELHGAKLFHPASVTKLFTAAAALETLGEGYRFKTPVYLRGNVDAQGTLEGDLILAGSGDFLFGGRTGPDGRLSFSEREHTYAVNSARAGDFPEGNPLAALEFLARQVLGSGVKRVRGDVMIDDRLFQTGKDRFGFMLTPMVINDNLIDFVFRPAEPGAWAAVEWRPRVSACQVDAQVRTAAPGTKPAIEIRSPGPGRIVVRGEIPAGEGPFLQCFQVPDPAGFARALFIEALLRAGVAVDASPLSRNPLERLPKEKTLPALRRVALWESPPFAEMIGLVLKNSHNLGAELTLLSLGAAHGRKTLKEAILLESSFLKGLGMETSSISLSDGKGGHPANLVTPRATVQFLRLLSTRPFYAALRKALPHLGTDGTLAHAVQPGSEARGRVQAKTGSLPYDDLLNERPVLLSKALAGYMTTSRGRELAFAFFVNHVRTQADEDVARVGRNLARICEILYNE